MIIRYNNDMNKLREVIARRSPINQKDDIGLFSTLKNHLDAIGLDRIHGREIGRLHDNLELILADAANFMITAGKAKFTADTYIQLNKDADAVYQQMGIFLDHRMREYKKKMHISVDPNNRVIGGQEGQLVVFVCGRGPLIGKWNNTSQMFLAEDIARQYPLGTTEDPDGFDICIGKVEEIDSADNEVAVSYIPFFR